MDLPIVGVLGLGQMGRGIAQVVAASGREVLMADAASGAAEAAVATIAAGLEKLVAKGKLDSASRESTLKRLRPVKNTKDLAPADLVVEAVSESEPLKIQLFGELDGIVRPTALLASNTSSISVTRLGRATRIPERVVGVHFMNPVPVMQLVEVIRGQKTSDATYASVRTFAESLGKTVVTSSDYPGFIVNRVLMPMINEAAYALMEGVASAVDIDTAMKLGTNQPMGPLTLADFIGLDTCLSILEVMHRDLGDSKYRPCPLLRRLVDSGRLGKKTGEGFHRYA